MHRPLTAALVCAVLAAAGCGGSAAPPATSSAPTAPPTAPSTAPPATSATGPARRPPRPIVLVMMENQYAGHVLGAACCAFETRLAERGIDFTHYYGVAYPSRPNYLAIAGGSVFGQEGIDDPLPTIAGDNVFAQLSRAGIGWKAWAESYPGGPGHCFLGATAGDYAMRHVAPLLFTDIAHTALCDNVVAAEPARLPAFLWVTPNTCDDDHDCPASQGDRWLSEHVPAWLRAGAEVFITFDTGNPDRSHGGGRVYAVLAGRGIPHRVVARTMTHYSTLAGLERAFHLPLLGAARTAAPVPFSR
jgi:acid phosphatase